MDDERMFNSIKLYLENHHISELLGIIKDVIEEDEEPLDFEDYSYYMDSIPRTPSLREMYEELENNNVVSEGISW